MGTRWEGRRLSTLNNSHFWLWFSSRQKTMQSCECGLAVCVPTDGRVCTRPCVFGRVCTHRCLARRPSHSGRGWRTRCPASGRRRTDRTCSVSARSCAGLASARYVRKSHGGSLSCRRPGVTPLTGVSNMWRRETGNTYGARQGNKQATLDYAGPVSSFFNRSVIIFYSSYLKIYPVK